jgi:hypothetical protein
MENVMKRNIKSAFLACILLSGSLGAAAQPHEFAKACGADIKTHCGNVEKGEGRIAECMKQNKDKLSDSCKAKLEEMRSKMKDRRGGESAGKGK